MNLSAFTPQEQAWLSKATERLRETINPTMVMVFGSRARGTASRKSDLDLLVVYDTQEPPLERIGKLLSLLADCPWPLEILAYTPEELQNIQNRPFIRRIQEEGKVVYEQRAA